MTSEEEKKRQQERREFFRIDDSVQVSIRLLRDDELTDHAAEQVVERKFTIMTRMQSVSQGLSAALHRIEQKDPDVADYLKALDQKINLLGQTFLSSETELAMQPGMAVNLSAGGIALNSADPLEQGDRVEIKLLLLPEFVGILSQGEVIDRTASSESAGFPHRLRIGFSDISESDRDALIRHILRRQAEMLRREREQREVDEVPE
jgi:c-di-GMP-binding flagellar brake protein YcgR